MQNFHMSFIADMYSNKAKGTHLQQGRFDFFIDTMMKKMMAIINMRAVNQ